MNEKTVSVKIKLSAEDYCLMQKQITGKTDVALSIFIAFFISLAIAATVLEALGIHILNSFPGRPIIVSVMTVLFTRLLVFFIQRNTTKTWTQQYNDNKLIQKEFLYMIKADGLEQSHDSGNNKYTWSDFHAFWETKEAFYIFSSQNQVYFLQKKNFNNEDEIEFVRECISVLPAYEKKKTPQGKVFRGLMVMVIIQVCIILLVYLFSLIIEEEDDYEYEYDYYENIYEEDIIENGTDINEETEPDMENEWYYFGD